MKYLKPFENKEAVDLALKSIKHGDGAYVFGIKTTTGISNITFLDQRHPVQNVP